MAVRCLHGSSLRALSYIEFAPDYQLLLPFVWGGFNGGANRKTSRATASADEDEEEEEDGKDAPMWSKTRAGSFLFPFPVSFRCRCRRRRRHRCHHVIK